MYNKLDKRLNSLEEIGMEKEKNKTSQDEYLRKVSFAGKMKLILRRMKNRLKNSWIKFKETDKKELFSNFYVYYNIY